jgi:hypothetical protein
VPGHGGAAGQLTSGSSVAFEKTLSNQVLPEFISGFPELFSGLQVREIKRQTVEAEFISGFRIGMNFRIEWHSVRRRLSTNHALHAIPTRGTKVPAGPECGSRAKK